MLKFLLVMVAILLLSPFLLGLLLRLFTFLLHRQFRQNFQQKRPVQFGNLTILRSKSKTAKRTSSPDESDEDYIDFEEVK
jgi:hypothetical protein